MDWSNESYVKLYRRETADDLLLSWEARALWKEMLTRFDRSGILKARRGARGLAALVRIPEDVVERVLPELLEDGRIAVTEGGWVAPNFMPAQEASKSNAQRQKEVRDKRRMQAVSHLSNGASHDSNGASHRVAPSHSDLIRADQSRSDPSRSDARAREGFLFSPELERRRIPEEPGVFMVIADDECIGLVRIDEAGCEVAVEP